MKGSTENGGGYLLAVRIFGEGSVIHFQPVLFILSGDQLVNNNCTLYATRIGLQWISELR